MNKPRSAIDWSQIWYPGPKQPFTADEMARAGSDAPSPTLMAVSAINFLAVAFVVLQIVPAQHTARVTAALVAMAALTSVSLRWLWWRPWRRPLMQVQTGCTAFFILLAAGIRWRVPERSDREAIAIVLAVGTAALDHFLAIGGLHADTVAVTTLTDELGGLICALGCHDVYTFS